jgi:hypothetical protein
MEEEKFENLEITHEHEEKLRGQSMELVAGDEELRRRFRMIEKAMALLFGYTIDHAARSADERTMQMLGIRLFNAAASGVKLALSGYYQTAFQQARDILETGFLLDYFRTSPTEISVWRASDRALRRKRFDPVKIRIALDERDGDTKKRREREYNKLSELASHASYRGFALTTRQQFAELGPFVEKRNLMAWAEEMVVRLGPAAVMYANQFGDAPTALTQFLQEFGTELIVGFRREKEDDHSAE